jgi:polar amino acid transport system substrate-binding protein
MKSTMKKKTILALLWLLAIPFLFSACATDGGKRGSTTTAPALQSILEKGEIVVGTAGDMAPLNMTVKSGKVVGLEPELAEYIADAMGVKLKIKTMQFSELLPALQAGRVDIVLSGMTITPKRNLKVAFVGPYFLSGKCVLTKDKALAEADDASDINRPEIKLAALKGSTSELFVEELIPKAQFVPAKNYEQAVAMVLDDKVNALIGDYPVCVVSLLRYPDRGLTSVISLLTQEPLGIALPGNDPLFVNWMNNFLQNLQSNGILDDLKEYWFDSGHWLKELP